MPFTLQQDTFIVMAHFRSATLTENGNWEYSLPSCFQQFHNEYPDVMIAYETFKCHRNRLIKRFMETGSVTKRKADQAPSVLTEDRVDDIRQRMDVSPYKSVRKLALQTGTRVIQRIFLFHIYQIVGISRGSAHMAVRKKLHMHPYKILVMQHLRVQDFEQRQNFCRWFNETLGDDDLDRSFFSDEAWFHLSGYVNSQNYRTWSAENPHVFVETNLHPIKVGVWIAMSRRRIIGPIFFHDTINAVRYREMLLEPFINSLDDEELTRGYFQQDGAPAHTARTTLNYLEEFYDDRLISYNRWPAYSPDLTPLDFFLFGYLKNKVYSNRLHNLDELQAAIAHEVQNITEEMLQNVFNNMRRRVNLCLQHNGAHFENHL